MNSTKKMISYDFSEFEYIMAELKNNQSKSVLDKLKRELNKFFKDSECDQVLFTNNSDKLFFGMRTYAFLQKEDVVKIISEDKPWRVEKYYIEIDSKILTIGLTAKELVAVLLHEVGHLVNDGSPANEIRKAVDTYLEEEKDCLSLRDTYTSVALFKFVINDTFRKVTSIFTKNDDEIIADEFVFLCGYGEDLESAFKKIKNSRGTVNTEVRNKLVSLKWAMDVYRNLAVYRTTAIKTLNKSKTYTGSQIEKRIASDAIDGLNKVSNEDIVREFTTIAGSIIVEGCEVEETLAHEASVVSKIQRKGLRGLEDDLFEYQMRIKNVEEEDEAILILRQINSRMAVIDDYLTCSKDLDEHERARWERCYDNYAKLRTQLSSTAVFNKKNYGLWFDYNYIDPNRK